MRVSAVGCVCVCVRVLVSRECNEVYRDNMRVRNTRLFVCLQTDFVREMLQN